jgi:hypothetical protein
MAQALLLGLPWWLRREGYRIMGRIHWGLHAACSGNVIMDREVLQSVVHCADVVHVEALCTGCRFARNPAAGFQYQSYMRHLCTGLGERAAPLL